MADPWTEAWMEAEASNPPELIVYDTLELIHDAFEGVPVRCVNGATSDMNFTLEIGAPFNSGASVLFQAIPFHAERPEFSEGKPPECQITVDGVGEEVSEYLEEAVHLRSDMTVIYRQYRSDDLTELCFGPVQFQMKSVKLIGSKITGRAMLADLTNRKFPNLVYTYDEFPGLQNV
jgi:hypothetical protein